MITFAPMKFLSTVLFLSLVNFSLGQITPILSSSAQTNGYTIDIDLKQLPDTVYANLYNANDPKRELVSSFPIIKGKGTHKGNIANPFVHYMQFSHTNSPVYFFLANENYKLTGTLDTLNWSGSSAQEQFVAYNTKFGPMFGEMARINTKAQIPGSVTDSLKEAFAIVSDKLQAGIENWLTQYPASYMTPIILLQTYQYNTLEELERRYGLISPAITNYELTKEIKKLIDNQNFGKIGSLAPDFQEPDVNGKMVKLSDFKGKYVLIDFWAGWCNPCRYENPNVVAAFKKYKNKNFTVLGVSLDRNREEWIQAIKEDNLTWTQVSEVNYFQSTSAKLYKVQSIPSNFLIDPNGKILAKNLRGENLETTLAEILNTKSKTSTKKKVVTKKKPIKKK
jgi:peroxiredoxin